MFPECQEVEVERDIEVQGKVQDENDHSQTGQGEEIATPPA